MEALLVGGLISYGIYINNKNNNQENFNRNIPIYSIQKKNVTNNYNKEMNKVDYSNKNLPLEFNENTNINIQDSNNNNLLIPPRPENTLSSLSPGISLTGEPIDENNFVHNNMVPFFGGTIKQNVEDFATKGIFENFTGNSDVYKQKQEIGPLFKPEANIGNPYGMSNLNNNIDRFNPSRIRNNVVPIERVNVGPGLNQGYTALPSGGFQQKDTRNYILPKTTNELRTVNNPKITYKGVILPGKKISKRGKVGEVANNAPDRAFQHGHNRLFTTVGTVMGPKQNGQIIIKHNSRLETGNNEIIGAGAPTKGSKISKTRSKVKESSKQQLSKPNVGGPSLEKNWTILNKNNNNVVDNYGKNAFNMRNNQREVTGKRTVLSTAKGPQTHIQRNNQGPRDTRKNNVVGNTRWASNIQAPHNRHKIYNPNDRTRTTIKETNIHNNHSGNMQAQKPSNQKIYNPNDRTRTTIKETNIHNNHSGNMQAQKPANQKIYNPNDRARTTIKGTNIHNNHSGNMQAQKPSNQKIYNPNDRARTTIKETNIHNNHIGNINGLKNKAHKVKSPGDIAKKTVKETTMARNVIGNTNTQLSGDGYKIKKIEVARTNRQDTSTEYVSQAKGDESGAYQVTDVTVPNTSRQFTCDKEYSGIAGGGEEIKPMSYSDIYNATITSLREEVSEGRAPVTQGSKTNMSKEMVKVTTSRKGDIQNRYLNERGNTIHKINSEIPTENICNITKDKDSVNNEKLNNRFDTTLLNAYNKNPYTHSLNSY